MVLTSSQCNNFANNFTMMEGVKQQTAKGKSCLKKIPLGETRSVSFERWVDIKITDDKTLRYVQT